MTELALPLIVVVTDRSSQAERLRALLVPAGYRVLPVSDCGTAEARIAGGGVDLVVVCVSPGPAERLLGKPSRLWESALRDCRSLSWAGGESHDPGMPPGMPPVVLEGDVVSTAHRLIGENAPREGSARIISLQGVKGGVGASTVALNLAARLSRQGKTILAEMQPGLGTWKSHFRPRRKIRTMDDLAAIPEAALTAADLADCLWPCSQVPGLSILFGPERLGRDFDWTPHVTRILRIAAGAADYVVVDLAPCVSGANRAALRATDYFLLVLERDAICLEAGRHMMAALDAERLLPHSTAAVVVSRVPLSAPIELPAVERELNLPVIGALPPAPDLCLLAYQSQTAVVALDPEGLLAASYTALADALTAALGTRTFAAGLPRA